MPMKKYKPEEVRLYMSYVVAILMSCAIRPKKNSSPRAM